MINETVTQPEAIKFFSMGAEYLIAPGSKPGQLMSDASSLLDSAIEVLDSQWEKLDGKLYAVMYLMQQAKSAHDEAHNLLVKAGSVEAS